MAEARIRAELRAAQERGEVATLERKAGTVRSANGAPASHTDLGIPRQRASDMRRMAELGESGIEAAVEAATEAGDTLTRRAMNTAHGTARGRQ